MTVDAAKVALGYNYKLSENVTFGPFWEYKTLGKDDNWQRKDAFVGTNFKVKF
jgi:opacity protein-like surface antigen